jgi:membrane-associated phospholipid phosphatase
MTAPPDSGLMARRREHVESSPHGSAAALFEPTVGGWAEHVAISTENRSPAVPVVGAFISGWAALSAVLIGVGFLLTKVLVEDGRGRWDNRANRWLADHRTALLNHVTSVATFLANTLPVVVVAAVICGSLLAFRLWRPAVFVLWGLATEITVFLTVNYVVDRSRPNVPRLDSTPSTGSYPSGHIAASLVLWVGLAIVVTALSTNWLLRTLVWLVAVVEPLTVGFARVYRGMHHVTDVLAGACLGLGCLLLALVGVRIVGAVVERRRRTQNRHDMFVSPASAAS